jgi:hypothetical protein
MRRPSKRLYPDYYQVIQTPVALEDVKKQLEHGGYASLEAVKQDFELCFNNAKQYNMKDSEIWKDAKDLLVRPSSQLAEGVISTGFPLPIRIFFYQETCSQNLQQACTFRCGR